MAQISAEQKLIHRDIKPANILIDQNNRAYLTDFGIAKIFSGSQLTQTGTFLGTPQYMSPEQAQGLELSAASDIYSLGITLYEMLTSHLPYNADTPVAVLYKQISDPLPLPKNFRADIPEQLEKILLKTLAKDAKERFQIVDDLLNAINQVKVNLSLPETIIEKIYGDQGTIRELIPGGNHVEELGNKATIEPKTQSRKTFIGVGLFGLVLIVWLIINGGKIKQIPIINLSPLPSATATLFQLVQNEATPTPTLTPTPIPPSASPTLMEPIPTRSPRPTSTPVRPQLLADQNYFCRQSPTKFSEAHWIFKKGDTAFLLGKAEDNWWLISVNDPTTRTKCCWVGGGSPSGNINILPFIDYEIDRKDCPKSP